MALSDRNKLPGGVNHWRLFQTRRGEQVYVNWIGVLTLSNRRQTMYL